LARQTPGNDHRPFSLCLVGMHRYAEDGHAVVVHDALAAIGAR
jgi:hypothetical protein